SEINAGLRLIGGERQWHLDNVPLLGDLLVEMRLIDHARFEIALDDYMPQRDGRIGDYLVKQGITTEEAVAQAMQEQRRRAAALQSPPPGALPA
ncbi:hypothetical protein, partial [Acinetobacter baumannii]|uniref:hypothetical protein n=1 Tax=Acinetobacter baumannii TaxID=470 RepID=UPI00208ECB50